MGIAEEGRYVLIVEAGNAAPYSGHKECELPVLSGELDKVIDIGLDFIHTALHGRNGIALALQADALAHHCTKPAVCIICRSTAMNTAQIAAKHEDLVGRELPDVFGRRELPLLALLGEYA